jgi:hypothetical protein
VVVVAWQCPSRFPFASECSGGVQRAAVHVKQQLPAANAGPAVSLCSLRW